MAERIRPFTAADIDFALVQTAREGWPSSRAWFSALLEHDPDDAFVVEDGGAPVAMITMTRYRDTGWVSNLIVVPEARRRGLGTRLMELALDRLADGGLRTVRLEADPPGVGIYRRLGFVEEVESLRFRHPGGDLPWPADAGVLEEIGADEARFDEPRFGDDRARLLRSLLRRARSAHAVRRGARLAGYALTVPTTGGVHLGPCVADGPETARRLAAAAARAAGGAPVTLGVLASRGDWRGDLEAAGFVAAPSSLRMWWGRPPAPGDPAAVFAIANGAMG